jgi:hypothetical protein
MDKFPSAKKIIEEAKRRNPKADINQLHNITFELIKKYRDLYYQNKVKEFLLRPSLVKLPKEVKSRIEKELLNR